MIKFLNQIDNQLRTNLLPVWVYILEMWEAWRYLEMIGERSFILRKTISDPQTGIELATF